MFISLTFHILSFRTLPFIPQKKSPLHFPQITRSQISAFRNIPLPTGPYKPCTGRTGHTSRCMNHAQAILVIPALIYSTHRLDYCCHFHLCSLVGRYTVLEVWAVRRPVRVSCGSRWGRCGLFINILDSLTAPCIRPCIQYTGGAASMAGAYVRTLAGAAGVAGAWFIRTPSHGR